jgi:hypothetical protein
MEGDLSRGHRPDAKRGRRYRRVLVKQGAPILDSDLAAMVDSGERSLREAVTHSGCDRGSPDLGFLVTPGELLAHFDPVSSVAFAATNPARAVRDFSRKHLDRLPGLRITGTGGSVSVPLRRGLAATTPCLLWLRADAGATARVNGVTDIAIPAGPDFAAFPLSLSGASLTLAPDPAAAYWIALVETRAESGPLAALHWAAGEYQIDGLIAPTEGAAWPGFAGPAAEAMRDASAAGPGTRMLAYLEICERHVTRVEDPGILEQALGGDQDSSTRSAVHAQVKIAQVDGSATAEAIAAAVVAPILPTGTVTLGTAAAITTADPCDLPAPGGYTGPDNRLYRLAVHEVTPGAGGETLFKWSRDNAAELYPVELPNDPVDVIRVRADLPLRAGDLVELLGEATDLGDAAPGAIGAGGFLRPRRLQGRLLRLDGGEVVSGSMRDFTLREPEGETTVAPFPRAPFGTGFKLRRWSGLIRRTGTGALTPTLENGIEAAIAGEFEPGDWWQYEARVLAQNANGPAAPEPHGPERLFAPLALLEQTPAGEPMRLLAWLDTRYRRLCETVADSVAYDGERAGIEADTVQEALDELYLRVSVGCGEIAVPLGGSIQDVIDAIPNGGSARICLNAGSRTLSGPVNVQNKGHLVITGTGFGTRLEAAGRQALLFEGCRSVRLSGFSVTAGQGAGPVIGAENCPEVVIDDLSLEASGPVAHGGAAIRVRMLDEFASARTTIRHNRLLLGHGDTGILLLDPGTALVEHNLVDIRPEPFDLLASLEDAATATAVGGVLLDHIDFHEDDAFDFVGGPILGTWSGPGAMTRHGFVMAPGMWGRSVLSFRTDRRLSSDHWEALVEANQPPAGRETLSRPMRDFLRHFRRGLAAATLRGGAEGVTIPGNVRPVLDTLAGLLFASNATAAGRAGIAVGLNATPNQARRNEESVFRLLYDGDGGRIAIRNNRIRGFTQGIRVGASRREWPQGEFPDRRHLARAVEIRENHVELRLPMQAKQRHGIFLGNALSAHVMDNRVIDPNYVPTPNFEQLRAVVDCDGIRLWGAYGPLVIVRGNLAYGVTVGVRMVETGAQGMPPVSVQQIRSLIDNAYVGDGFPDEIGSP